MEGRPGEVGEAVFDKEDDLAVEFVTAASNLRAAAYGIPRQSQFDAKVGMLQLTHPTMTVATLDVPMCASSGQNPSESNLVSMKKMLCTGYGRQHHPCYCHHKRHCRRTDCHRGHEAAGRRS